MKGQSDNHSPNAQKSAHIAGNRDLANNEESPHQVKMIPDGVIFYLLKYNIICISHYANLFIKGRIIMSKHVTITNISQDGIVISALGGEISTQPGTTIELYDKRKNMEESKNV